jgi:hypothetical protein
MRLSLEALLGLFAGSIFSLLEWNWELRSLGVLFTLGLAIHIAKLLNASWFWRIAFVVAAGAVLLAGTWHPIWIGYNNDFPTGLGQKTLARIIEFAALALVGIAAYVFLIRPDGRKGYRVLPAQVIAFGAVMSGIGLLTVFVGLGWQFKQNLAVGIGPTGAPTFSLVPPRITQEPPIPALPPPPSSTQPPAAHDPTPYFTNYNLTPAGVTALADELFKARDALGKRIELDRMATDSTAGSLLDGFTRACDQAGVDCPVNNVHPNTPDEKGLLIYVADPHKPPAAAETLRTILLALGINIPFVSRVGIGPPTFSLFVGPRPPT